jgi:hypothetical protein
MGRDCSTLGRDKKFVQNFSRNLKGTDHLEHLAIDGRIILKWIVKIFEDVDCIHSGNETYGPIKGGEFFDQMRDC